MNQKVDNIIIDLIRSMNDQKRIKVHTIYAWGFFQKGVFFIHDFHVEIYEILLFSLYTTCVLYTDYALKSKL